MSSSSTLLTIVTVLKDDPLGLQRTMHSLGVNQPRGIEWLVVDSSADVDRVSAVLSHSTWDVTRVWTKPAGVFNAMNVGLNESHGTYVWFLNAGDTLHSRESLDSVVDVLVAEPTWAFGQVEFVNVDGQVTLPKPFDYRQEKRHWFARGRFPPHQGTIARRQVLCDLGSFDESYRIAADYAMMLRLALIADPVESTEVWADFHEGGLSTTQWRSAIGEFHQARMEILGPSGLELVKEKMYVGREILLKAGGRALRSLRGN